LTKSTSFPTSPVAAVGLRELDCANAVARFAVRILSPRILGGWCCQHKAAQAAQVLHRAGMGCSAAEMEYLKGSDCFCVSLTVTRPVYEDEEGWSAGSGWQVLRDGVEEKHVRSFRAVRNQGRRLVGAFCQSEPTRVTPGAGGWQLELVQSGAAEPEEGQEPFVLTVHAGGVRERYLGCCWNETEIVLDGGGLKRIRRGFALKREADKDG
jgi:hypothetical protein